MLFLNIVVSRLIILFVILCLTGFPKDFFMGILIPLFPMVRCVCPVEVGKALMNYIQTYMGHTELLTAIRSLLI